jgi:1-deoxy-D-xylulose-5-phosphate reductoisomerase
MPFQELFYPPSPTLNHTRCRWQSCNIILKRIVILGSTGSIGQSTVRVIAEHRDRFHVVGLTGHNNPDELIRQARLLNPEYVAVTNPLHADKVRNALPKKTIVLVGDDALVKVATMPVDQVVCALVGLAGLRPTLAALRMGQTLALANKECLVAAGKCVMQTAQDFGGKILPIDSEHNALFQLMTHNPITPETLTLTASGGPFLNRPHMDGITLDDALRHPNWAMGVKNTVDSATMMNKGLEVIEAHHLFAFPYDRIHVVIHPQSIVHGWIGYPDGSILSHMGIPDMRIPISYALAWPDRLSLSLPPFDLARMQKLTFDTVDKKRFPCFSLAMDAARTNKTLALNAANDIAVEAFVAGHIGFHHIAEVVDHVLQQTHETTPNHEEDILEMDERMRRLANEVLDQIALSS